MSKTELNISFKADYRYSPFLRTVRFLLRSGSQLNVCWLMLDVLKSDVANIKRWYLSFSHQTTKRLLQHLLEHLPALLAQYPCSVCYFNPQKSTTYYFASIIPINYTPLFHYIEKKREKRSQQIPGVKTQGKKVVVNLQEVLYPGLKSIKYLLPCCAIGPYSLSITPTPN